MTQNLRGSKCSSKRGVYSNTIQPQEIRKILNKQPILTLKTIRETNKQTKNKSRRKQTIKIMAETSEREMKKTIAKISENKGWF